MIIWGMVGNSHDASLAVFENKLAGLTDRYKTTLLSASLAKDFSKIEHDPDFNQNRKQYLRAYKDNGKTKYAPIVGEAWNNFLNT